MKKLRPEDDTPTQLHRRELAQLPPSLAYGIPRSFFQFPSLQEGRLPSLLCPHTLRPPPQTVFANADLQLELKHR